MIRCVRLWTGQDGGSHFRDGRLDILPGRNNDLVSPAMSAAHVKVEETAGGGSLAWHNAPVRQLVVTLSGTLIFSTRDGDEFTLRPGDVLPPRTPQARVISGDWRVPTRGDECMSYSNPTPTSRSHRTVRLSDPRRCPTRRLPPDLSHRAGMSRRRIRFRRTDSPARPPDSPPMRLVARGSDR
jgi:hypothetical protein